MLDYIADFIAVVSVEQTDSPYLDVKIDAIMLRVFFL